MMHVSQVIVALSLALVSHVDGLPRIFTAASGPNGSMVHEKIAYLVQLSATGTRNVRWETMPNNAIGSDGKPAPTQMGVFECLDVSGRMQPNGNEYMRPNGKFKYRCTNGIEEVVACMSAERAGKKWMNVGETLVVNGFWHKCEAFPNSSVIYTQEDACHYNGKDYHAGDELKIGFLRFTCRSDGYKVIGCYYTADNGDKINMERGAKVTIGKVTHVCEDNKGDIRYYNIATGCTRNGKDYKEGEEFAQNHLQYKCENGIVGVKGCYIDDARSLKVDADLVDAAKHMVYRCYRMNGNTEYMEYACGGTRSAARSCTPEPIPQTPDDVPALAPGFGTFAVVQSMGDSMAAQPNTLKLDLDKILSGVQH